MSGFISGADRGQATMFPAQLEDYVAEDNPVRVSFGGQFLARISYEGRRIGGLNQRKFFCHKGIS